MKNVYLILPVAIFLASPASAITQDEKDAKAICNKHLNSLFVFQGGSYNSHSFSGTFNSGFSICEGIMQAIIQKEEAERDKQDKDDLVKLNKFAAATGVNQCK